MAPFRHLLLTRPLRSISLTLIGLSTLWTACKPSVPLPSPTQPTLSATSTPQNPSQNPYTFSQHIAPLIFHHCAPCHQEGQSAPFPLTQYSQVAKRSRQILEVVQARYMPPWPPNPNPAHPFHNERRLSDSEINLLTKWIEAGTPEGDPSQTPPYPKSSSTWRLGPPDQTLSLSSPFLLTAEGTDVFRNFILPNPFDTLRYIRAIQFRPSHPQNVHHAVLALDDSEASRRLDLQDPLPGFAGMEMGEARAPGGYFIGWTPGNTLFETQPEASIPLVPNTDIVVQLHLLPSGKPEAIDFEIGLYFTDQAPRHTPYALLLNSTQIDIPPGEKNYLVTDTFLLPVPVQLHSLYPHAHYLGKDLQVQAILPDSSRIPLIHIPNWDFSWQEEYRYQTPISLPAGTKLSMIYTYDNSSENHRNPNHPPQRVTVGNGSLDEMATATLQVWLENPDDHSLLEEAQMRHQIETTQGNWKAHTRLGTLYAQQQRFQEALKHFHHALEIEPGYVLAHNNLGNVHAAQGQWDQAIQHYQQAILLEPSHFGAHLNLGNLYLHRQQPDLALPLLLRATQFQTNHLQAHFFLARAYQLTGDHSRSRNHLLQAQTLAKQQNQPSWLETVTTQIQSLR